MQISITVGIPEHEAKEAFRQYQESGNGRKVIGLGSAQAQITPKHKDILGNTSAWKLAMTGNERN